MCADEGVIAWLKLIHIHCISLVWNRISLNTAAYMYLQKKTKNQKDTVHQNISVAISNVTLYDKIKTD